MILFSYVHRLASRYGLEFVLCEPFQSFYERMRDKSQGRALLGRMQALEVQPIIIFPQLSSAVTRIVCYIHPMFADISSFP